PPVRGRHRANAARRRSRAQHTPSARGRAASASAYDTRSRPQTRNPLSRSAAEGARRSLFASAVDEALELLAAARVPELAQRLRPDLADALARALEVLTDFFERVIALLADTEAHAQDLLLARRQRLEDLPRLLGEVHVDDRLGRREDALVLDEV